MEIVHSGIYHIDFEDEVITPADIDGEDIKEFIKNVIDEMLENLSTKKYKIKRNSTEVINIGNKLVLQERNPAIMGEESAVAISVESDFEAVAKKLMESEIKAQENIERMNAKVKKGSLIQILIEEDDKFKYALIKIEHESYLEKDTLIKKVGLPLDKKVLKTCVIEYDDNDDIKNIRLYDSSGKIAQYWWDYLLELEQLRDDFSNTEDSFMKLNSIIEKEVGSKNKKIMLELKNKSNAYYEINEQFYMAEYLDKVIDSVDYGTEDIDKEKIKTKMEKAINKICDGQFTIDKSGINTIKPDTIVISEQISLVLKSQQYDYTGKIVAEIENDKKVLKLIGISDDIYRVFVPKG